MTPAEEEKMWRDRFILLQLTRIGGTVIVLLGLYLWYGPLVQPGGSIVLGLPVALIGLVISFWGPRQLARRWRRTPPQQ